jgi:hypothetical protein
MGWDDGNLRWIQGLLEVHIIQLSYNRAKDLSKEDSVWKAVGNIYWMCGW